jgi:hypothetical protein
MFDVALGIFIQYTVPPVSDQAREVVTPARLAGKLSCFVGREMLSEDYTSWLLLEHSL